MTITDNSHEDKADPIPSKKRARSAKSATPPPLVERMAEMYEGPPPVLSVPDELAGSPWATNDTASPEAPRDVRALDVALIDPSSANVPHREPDAELIASVREHGVLEPILVRPKGDGRDVRYELVYGERRWKAALRAGRVTVLAEVRVLSDQEALDLQVEENLHRENLTPLQEATVFRAYEVRHGATTEEIARRVHKSERYVVQRLKLLDLSETARAALAAGRILLGTAIEIACLPEADREKATALVLPFRDEGALSVREARDRLTRQFHLRMAQARWDLADAGLVPAAGACVTCPKRTNNQLALTIDGIEPDDRCTDRTCFTAKGQALWLRRKVEAERAGLRVLDATVDGKEGAKARDMIQGWKSPLVRLDSPCRVVAGASPRDVRVAAAERELEEATKRDDSVAMKAASEKLDALDDEGDEGERTWREVLGPVLGDAVRPVAIGRERDYDGQDKVVELVDERTALQVLKAQGVKLEPWAEQKMAALEGRSAGAGGLNSDDDATKARDRQMRTRERTEELVTVYTTERIVEAAERTPPRPGPDFFRALVRAMLESHTGWDEGQIELTCIRRGWPLTDEHDTPNEVVRSRLDNLTEGQLRGLAMELLCGEDLSLAVLSTHFAVDAKEVAARAAKAAKAELAGHAKPVKEKPRATKKHAPTSEEVSP